MLKADIVRNKRKNASGSNFISILFFVHLQFLYFRSQCPAVGLRNVKDLRLLIDPVELALLVGDDLLRLEPESNLLLGVLNAVGTMADITANILLYFVSKESVEMLTGVKRSYNGVVTTDGARGRGKRVGSTEDSCDQI